MDFTHVSPQTYLLTEDEETLEFKLHRYGDEMNPSSSECKGKIKGVCLSYACCGEQDFGISPMANQFGATGKNMIVKKIPKGLKIIESEGVKAIKFGDYARLDSNMIHGTKGAGVIGYWDDSNFIICATDEYNSVIDSIMDMFKPNHVRFGFSHSFGGGNLLILAI